MEICIIATGDELLRGAIADANSAWIAARLDERGLTPKEIRVVGDDVERMSDVFASAFAAFDLVIVGGGLGPTDDDLTALAAARALGTQLGRSEIAAAQVRAAFARMDRPMHPVNLKQADLPTGARVLENDFGTAPGFELDTAGGRALFFPGVPSELRPMFERHVLPALPQAAPRCRAIFKCFGMGESNIQATLRPIADAWPQVRWGYRPHFPEITILAQTAEAEVLGAVRAQVLTALGKAGFGEDDIGLPAALGRALTARKLTIAAAESCTGGLIGDAITSVPGASAYFRGSIVAYDNAAKTRLLGVKESALALHGAVSEQVVCQMAEGARAAFGADIGLATSGIAGPTGGSEEKPLGLVHMAMAHAKGVDRTSRIFKGYDRSRVKLAAAWSTIHMAFSFLAEEK